MLQSIGISHADCMPSMPKEPEAFISKYINTLVSQKSTHVQRLLMEAIIVWSDEDPMPFVGAVARFASKSARKIVLSHQEFKPYMPLLRPRRTVACPLVLMPEFWPEPFIENLNPKCIKMALAHPRFDADVVPGLIHWHRIELLSRLLKMGILSGPQSSRQSRKILMAAFEPSDMIYYSRYIGNHQEVWKLLGALNPLMLCPPKVEF
jgi:hypothetical protein